jgi:DNA-binding protein HU-beta
VKAARLNSRIPVSSPCADDRSLGARRLSDSNEKVVKTDREGGAVNKTELIEHIARQADISKAAAGRALEAIVGGIRTSLKKGNSVTLVGFGTFMVGKRAARTGRNPRTNQPIKIKAAKVPKFRAGKALKDAVN